MTFGRTCLLGSFLLFGGGRGLLHADGIRQAGAFTCAPGWCEEFELESTDRLPGAHGRAALSKLSAGTAIDVALSGVKPATLFGGDYNTYVLWAVAPGNRMENVGEFVLDGSRSRLKASTALESFALVVTAEPHFLVERPSSFVVLQSETGEIETTINYSVVEGVYYFERGSLDGVKSARGIVHTGVKQALTAVRLAQRMDAGRLAKPEIEEAERALDCTIDQLRQGRGKSEVETLARRTVRLAVAAHNLALARAFQNARVK
jgi:hypothetical protein